MAYLTEKELFGKALNSNYFRRLEGKNSLKIVEPKGFFGIPDLLVAKRKRSGAIHSIMAFEMKLRNWKRALSQAFKYRAFSNLSFVVVDSDHSAPAIDNIRLFQRVNVGLLSLDDEGNIRSHFSPRPDEPYCKAFYEAQLTKLFQVSPR